MTCDYCEKDSVVQVNGANACSDHIDQVMGDTFGPLKEALREGRA